MINWAKRLLKPKDSSPLLENGFDEEGNPIEVDEPTYDVCGQVLDSEYPTCPVCGVALCGDKERADEHIDEHIAEWLCEDEDEDDPPQYCDQCGNVIPDGETWCLDVRDGTEHFCCAECQHERAAEIEAAPLCAWCHEKCDQGVVHPPDSSVPFCSTDCAAKFRASSATGRCDDCGRDGDCGHCPGHPGGVPANPFDPGDVPFIPFHADSEVDRCFLESDFGKASIPLVATTGWRAARQNGKTYYPAFDRTVWYRENGYWKRCPSRW